MRQLSSVRVVLALLSVPTVIGIAVPAHADPGSDDAAFLASLQKAGITYGNADQAIAAGKTVCALIGDGKSGLEVVRDLEETNPGFTLDGAAKFAGIAASAYCPQQLSRSGSGSDK